MPSFEVRWHEHVDFGTSRSHKKKATKQMEWRGQLETRKQEVAAREAAADESTEPPPAKRAAVEVRDGGRARPKTKPATTVLASKGRFGGTLAASLLGGGQQSTA